MELRTGSVFGAFQLAKELGRGGMGVVFEAIDTRLSRTVALKVLHSETAKVAAKRARFLREARSAASIHHPNVATVFEAGELDGQLYIAMELVAGQTLREKLRAGRLAPSVALDYATQIANGLHEAHEAGVVHRDLKPENIMVTPAGRVVVLDFGLAKWHLAEESSDEGVQAPDSSALTQQGQIMGTPGYMAPEQFTGGTIDPRTDLFAFGAVLFEMLCGRRAFAGATANAVLNASLVSVTPSLEDFSEGLPLALHNLVERCLEKEARFRPPSVKRILEQLSTTREALTDDGVPGQEPSRQLDTLDSAEQAETTAPLAPPHNTLPLDADPFARTRSSDAWGESLGELDSAQSLVSEGRARAARRGLWLVVLVGIAICFAVFAFDPNPGEVHPGGEQTAQSAGDSPSQGREPGEASARASVTPSVVYTADGAPSLGASATLEAEHQKAWQALLGSRFSEARRRSKVLTEALPAEAGPHLLLALAAVLDGDTSTSWQELWAAQRAGEGREDLVAQLAQIAVLPVSGSWPPARQELERFLAAHPDDYLARIEALMFTISYAPSECDRYYELLLALDERHVLPYDLEAYCLTQRGLFKRAMEVANKGLEFNPSSARLHFALAQAMSERGDFESANDNYRRALQGDPGLTQARVGWAFSKLMSGDEEGAERIWEQVMDPALSVRVRVQAMTALSRVRSALGQVSAALEVLGRAKALAVESDDVESAWSVDAERLDRLLESERYKEALRELEGMRLMLSRTPEVASEMRERGIHNLLAQEGTLLARLGRVDEARTILERVSRLGGAMDMRTRDLARVVAVKTADIAALDALHGSPGTCAQELEAGLDYLNAGEVVRGTKWLERALGREAECSTGGTAYLNRLQAHARLAEFYLGQSELRPARANLDHLVRLLPAPDEGFPLAQKMRALRAKLPPPEAAGSE